MPGRKEALAFLDRHTEILHRVPTWSPGASNERGSGSLAVIGTRSSGGRGSAQWVTPSRVPVSSPTWTVADGHGAGRPRHRSVGLAAGG